MPRRNYQAQPSLDVPKNRELLEGLLTLEGSTGETYSRFYNYSPRNIGFLALQGCPPQPVATFAKWKELGFHVMKGEKAYSILRPIQVRVRDEDEPDNPEKAKSFTKFKVVRALFHYAQVAGEGELPPYNSPEWSVDRALGELSIDRVPFREFDGNVGGYAVGRTIAINPMAPFPLRTTLHEISHVEHGHTTPDNLALYQGHRGQYEFEAEASAHVVLNELGELDEQAATVSRGYVQGWLKNQEPSEQSLRKVLNVSTAVLNAGYVDNSTENAA